MSLDDVYMKIALMEARRAYKKMEVPVGAVIVYRNNIIAKAHNTREQKQSPIGHAEINAIIKASTKLKSWKLENCELYVTLEPCPMCSGAIIQSRFKRVVYGAKDPKAGACGSVVDLFSFPFNHRVEVLGGILADECGQILTDFFKDLREVKKS